MKTLSTMFLVFVIAATAACKKDADAKTPDKKVTGAADKPSTQQPAPEPAEKPLAFTETLDIGAAVLKADPDDTGWKGITITAPKGAAIDTAGGLPSVVITDHMAIGLGGERDLKEKRQQAQDDSLQKFSRFLVDQPDAILWEAKSSIDGTPNYLVFVNVKLGDKVKSCETSGYGNFTQANAEAILAACRGMKQN